MRLGAAGNSSTEYGYIRICTNKKQEAKIPLLKVLEILKNFFQEVFKQGLGQSPKVFRPLPVRIAELNGAVEIAGENQL